MGRNGEHGSSVSSSGSEPVVRERRGVPACSAPSIGVNTLRRSDIAAFHGRPQKPFPPLRNAYLHTVIQITHDEEDDPTWRCYINGRIVRGEAFPVTFLSLLETSGPEA
jgi:hypothetical protein